jgi:hypothetical protein
MQLKRLFVPDCDSLGATGSGDDGSCFCCLKRKNNVRFDSPKVHVECDLDDAISILAFLWAISSKISDKAEKIGSTPGTKHKGAIFPHFFARSLNAERKLQRERITSLDCEQGKSTSHTQRHKVTYIDCCRHVLPENPDGQAKRFQECLKVCPCLPPVFIVLDLSMFFMNVSLARDL